MKAGIYQTHLLAFHYIHSLIIYYKFILEHKETQSTPKLWLLFHWGMNISGDQVDRAYAMCNVNFPKSHQGHSFSKYT